MAAAPENLFGKMKAYRIYQIKLNTAGVYQVKEPL